MHQIATQPVYSLHPEMDYQSIVVDYEDDSPIGRGSTPQIALRELITQLADNGDIALASALEAMRDLDAAEAAEQGHSADYIAGIKRGYASVVGSL